MGINLKNVITCIDFGTSRIAVLHGTIDRGGNPEIAGFASASSEGCICKGEIIDVVKASNILNKVLEQADQSAGLEFERGKVYCSVSGPGIESCQGEGNVMIYEGDRKVTKEHIFEAVKKAESISLPPDKVCLNTFDSFFMLDSKYHVQNPADHTASRLDAFLHIILADRNRIETIRSIVREQGFESAITCVFSAAGSLYGVLRADEKQKGVLLIDMGAGLTDYVLVKDDGILLSGVVPVGTDNIANDLSLGLDLNIDQCRKLITEGKLENAKNAGEAYMEFSGSAHNMKRKIPVGSFEKIIDARLTELFTIIREKVESRNLSSQMEQCGAVFTGGGSLFPPAEDILRNVMGVCVRRGDASGVSGSMNGITPSCRYASVIGLLKFAAEDQAGSGNASLSHMGDMLEGFGEKFVRKFNDVTKAFKL